MKFCSLYSGSSGNCIFVGNGNDSNILIDAGVSGTRIERALQNIGEDVHSVKAILITHEHSDHVAGAGILSRRFNIPVFANEGTWAAMDREKLLGKFPEVNRRVIITGTGFEIGDFCISSFSVPHDAAAPVAYTVTCGEHKISVATDMGYVTEDVRKSVSGSELVLLESNHDIEMLKFGKYPMHLKRRILGEKGHLSNESAASLVTELATQGTKYFVLGHLSKENNFPQLAFETSRAELLSNGFNMENNFYLSVAQRDSVSEVIEL